LVSAEDFRPLFNGEDLAGWEVVTDGLDSEGPLFAVSDGVIHVYPQAENGSRQPFAGLVTEESFGDYHLSLEYKWGAKRFEPRRDAVRDAGVIFHIVGEPVIWPTGIECQIQEGDTGNIWIIGQTRASSPVQPVGRYYDAEGDLETRGAGFGPVRFQRGFCREQPDWNRVELIVRGNHAVYLVNGHQVNEAYNMRFRENPDSEWDWRALSSGRILLQAEGAEIFYRDIRIKSLAP